MNKLHNSSAIATFLKLGGGGGRLHQSVLRAGKGRGGGCQAGEAGAGGGLVACIKTQFRKGKSGKDIS